MSINMTTTAHSPFAHLLPTSRSSDLMDFPQASCFLVPIVIVPLGTRVCASRTMYDPDSRQAPFRFSHHATMPTTLSRKRRRMLGIPAQDRQTRHVHMLAK
ncbi:hypothetical protein IQ06DRAFT_155588 [Phaeosphaeriaceae sp. SRC1lsM3a]|nr:hypothetical protein IQ06DRAFT_155588 [Stagonospora sp. SRC1lsM3a]